jgi:hypothetical protein
MKKTLKSDIYKSWMLEEEIMRLGYEFRKKYQDNLIDTIESEIDSADLIGNLYFYVAHATPHQRYKAAIKTMKELY